MRLLGEVISSPFLTSLAPLTEIQIFGQPRGLIRGTTGGCPYNFTVHWDFPDPDPIFWDCL
jgi:hypothetical protein